MDLLKYKSIVFHNWFVVMQIMNWPELLAPLPCMHCTYVVMSCMLAEPSASFTCAVLHQYCAVDTAAAFHTVHKYSIGISWMDVQSTLEWLAWHHSKYQVNGMLQHRGYRPLTQPVHGVQYTIVYVCTPYTIYWLLAMMSRHLPFAIWPTILKWTVIGLTKSCPQWQGIPLKVKRLNQSGHHPIG